MDPLSITTAVIAVSARCVSTAQTVYGLREKYGHAKMMISAIYSESTVISASLGHIQGLISKDPETMQSTLRSRPELEPTFDQALTGCVLVFSVLEDEVQKLHDGADSAMGPAKYVWKEQTMKELLQQIRGQQTALSLLIQALQMTSISDIKDLLVKNNAVLAQVAQRTTRLRQANPQVRAPPSVFNMAVDDGASVFTYNSIATSTDFSFDDVLVNSQAYRRALAASRGNHSASTSAKDTGDNESSSDSKTIAGKSQSASISSAILPDSIKQKLSPQEVLALVEALSKATTNTSTADEVDVDELQSDYQELRESHRKLREDYFQKDYRMQELQKAHYEQKTVSAKLQAEKRELEAHCTRIEDAFTRNRNNVTELKQGEYSLRQENGILEAKLAEQETTSSADKVHIDKLQSDLQGLRESWRKLREDFLKKDYRVQELQKAHSEQKSVSAKLEVEKRELEAHCTRIEDAFARSRNDITELKQEEYSLRQEKGILEAKLAEQEITSLADKVHIDKLQSNLQELRESWRKLREDFLKKERRVQELQNAHSEQENLSYRLKSECRLLESDCKKKDDAFRKMREYLIKLEHEAFREVRTENAESSISENEDKSS